MKATIHPDALHRLGEMLARIQQIFHSRRDYNFCVSAVCAEMGISTRTFYKLKRGRSRTSQSTGGCSATTWTL